MVCSRKENGCDQNEIERRIVSSQLKGKNIELLGSYLFYFIEAETCAKLKRCACSGSEQ